MLENEKLQENMNLNIFMTSVIPVIVSITEKKDKIKSLIMKKVLLFEFEWIGGKKYG